MPYYWRLSSFYFLFFAAVGVLLPYWTLYLSELGYSELQIGVFMGSVMLVKIVAPFFWGWLADLSGRPVRVLRIGALGAAIGLGLLLVSSNWWWMLGAMLVANLFSVAILPQVEAFAMRELDTARDRYGQVRLWGSVGFIVTVVLTGLWVDARGVGAIVLITFVIHIAVFGASFCFTDTRLTPSTMSAANAASMLNRHSLMFLIACLLMQLSHGPFYTFFTVELAALGFSKFVIGMLWAFGVLCEIGIFLIMDRVFARFDVLTVLIATFAIAVIRWLLLALFGDNVAMLVLVQSLHAVTFGAWHAAAVKFVFLHFPQSAHHRGQSLYGAVSLGLGTALGSYLSGIVLDQFGATAMWLMAATAAGLAIVFALPLVNARGGWQRRSDVPKPT